MGPKRPFHGDGEDGMSGPDQEAKRFKNAVRDVMGLLSVRDFVSKMEPFLREVVRDEVERTVLRALQPSSRHSFQQAGTAGGRGLLLQFVNKLPSTIFTASKIEAEGGSPIRVLLLDATTNSIVSSGPLSSMKIEVLALNGDFGSDDKEDWCENEFTASITREREDRRPLVTGDLNITLEDGVGQIGDVVFTDNSSWQRSGKFRLGLRPVPKVSDGPRIREARSEAFKVKDHRGELYKKHYPPRLDDEVWRLEKIAKDGAFHKRLTSSGILNVKAFLRLYMINPSNLREMLGVGISNRVWDKIMEHANSCVVDDDTYYAYSEAGQSVELLFDSIYKVVAAKFDGPNYESVSNLAHPQKVLVENLKRQAYNNVNSFVPVDSNTFFGPSRPLTSLQLEQFHGSSLGLQQIEFPVTRPGQPEMQLDFNTPSSSTPFAYPAETSGQFEVYLPQTTTHPMQVLPQMLRHSFKIGDFFNHTQTEENSWHPTSSHSQWPVDDISQFQIPANWASVNSTWGQGNNFFLATGNEGELGIISSHSGYGEQTPRSAKPRVEWCKLRAALLWRSVKREVAAKRLWQDLCIPNF